MCNEAVQNKSCMLLFVPDHLKTKEMCKRAVEDSWLLGYVPDRFKTQEICNKAVEEDPWQLGNHPDHFKTQEMCDKAVRDYLFSLLFIPDWFVTQQQIDIWYDNDYVYNNDNRFVKWYDGYKKRKAQIASIEKELIPIAWHPSR